MDALETIGLKQYDRNQMYRDYYLMADGKLSFMEMADVIPQLRNVQKLRSDIRIPSFLKHYDIIGGIVNAFEGWLTNLQDKYTVNEVGDMAISEYEDTMSNLLHRHIQEQWDIIVNQRLVEAGLDPTYNEFNSEEERQAYVRQIQQAKASMTPDDIQRFMSTRWKTQAAGWGGNIPPHEQGLPKRKPLRRLHGQGWQFGRNAALSSGSRRSRNPPRRAHVPDPREGYHRLL